MGNVTAREAWLGIKDGALNMEAKKVVFSAPDGRQGTLTEMCASDDQSAHPGNWMFRLEGSLRWYWETELSPVPGSPRVWIITRMPSTGSVTNIDSSDRPLADVRKTWADVDCVSVISDEEFDALPRCDTCGEWVELRRCADCR